MNFPPAPRQGQQGQLLIMILAVGVLILSGFIPSKNNAPALNFFIVALGVGLGLLTWLAPKRLTYRLADSELVIGRLTGQTRLPYAGMEAWRTAGRLGVRVGGTGLPAYYTGHYTFGSDGLKRVLAASSNTSNGVIVQAEGKSYFLTPAEPEQFLQELARRGARVKA